MVARESRWVEHVQINHDAYLNFNFVGKIPHGIQHSLLGEKPSGMGQGDWPFLWQLWWTLSARSGNENLGPPTTFGYSGSRFCSHFPLFGHNKCISRAPWRMTSWGGLCPFTCSVFRTWRWTIYTHNFRSLTSNPSPSCHNSACPSVSCRPSKEWLKGEMCSRSEFSMSSLLLL